MDKVTKSLRWLRIHKPKEFGQAILQMSDQEVSQLLFDYRLFARDSQLPPEGDWRYWIVLAGRGLV